MSVVVLGIETSGSWCSAALSRGAEHFVRRAEVGNGHSARLLGMIDEVLADAKTTLEDCDVLAFSAGPGSFTGLRVGCALAQGLAFGADLAVAPVGTLDAIAHSLGVEGSGTRRLLVAQDARMGEVYWSLLERTDDHEAWRAVIGPSLDAPSALRDRIADRLPIDAGCGNAWLVHGVQLAGLVGRVVERQSADALDIAALGVIAAREGRLVAPDAASPLYVRNDVARTTAQREASARERLVAAD